MRPRARRADNQINDTPICSLVGNKLHTMARRQRGCKLKLWRSPLSLCVRGAFAFAAVHLPARAIHAAFDYMLGSLYMKVARARRNKGRIYF